MNRTNTVAFPPNPSLLACSSTFLLIPFVRYSVVSGEDGGNGSYGRQSQSQNEEEEKRRREKINMTDRTGKGEKVFASCITTQTERKCEPFLPLLFLFSLLLVPKHDLTARNGEEDFLPLSSSCRYVRQKRGWLVSSFISRFRRVLTSSPASDTARFNHYMFGE